MTGDFNINLDTQHEFLTPLADQQFVDVWRAKKGDSPGYTDPYAFDRTLAKRIDGFFVQRDVLDSTIGIFLLNTEPVNSGNLLLSDHIGVMVIFDFSCQQRRSRRFHSVRCPYDFTIDATPHRRHIRGRAGGKIIWQPRIRAWYTDKKFAGEPLPEPYTKMEIQDIFRALGCSAWLY